MNTYEDDRYQVAEYTNGYVVVDTEHPFDEGRQTMRRNLTHYMPRYHAQIVASKLNGYA